MALKAKEKQTLIYNLATLIKAGVPISDALQAMQEDSTGKTKEILFHVKETVGQGRTLSDALGQFPKDFDTIMLNLISAGEESGNLELSLERAAEQLKKNMVFKSKVKSALAYPILVFMLFIFVVCMMLFFVIPRISSVFTSLDMQLPLVTRGLIYVSNFLSSNALYVAIGAGILLFATILIFIFEKRILYNIFTSIPGISGLVVTIDTTTFTRNLSMLLKSGVSIDRALELSLSTVNKKQVKNAINFARENVIEGKPMHEGLARSGVFQNTVLTVIRAGEKGGSLDAALENISEQLEYETDTKFKNLTNMLEPIMLVVIGLFVGFTMLSIIAPIYQMIGNISPR